MDKKRLIASTLAALTVTSAAAPTAFAAQEDTPVPYAVMSTKALEDAGIALLSNEDTTAPQSEATLQEQINNAENGATITLKGDTSEDVTIPADKNIVLNLGGFTLTNKSGHTITNNGTLTIEGSGTVDNVTHQKAAIYNNEGGVVILNGGTYTRSQEKGADANNSGGNSYYNIVNLGTMTINDGVEVTSGGHYSSLIENGFYNGTGKTTDPKLTINGGTFSGGLNTVKNDDRGVLEIIDGTFTNVSQAAVLNWNNATIEGGGFQANAGAQAVILNGHIDDEMDCGKLTINGGSFTAVGSAAVIQQMTGSGAQKIGTIEINDGTFTTGDGEIISLVSGTENAAKINITKGSFTTTNEASKTALTQYVDPASEFDAATGTVSELPAERAVASIGAKNYASFDAALNAAQAGDTIKLEADVQTTGATEIHKALTIDFNGKTLTSEGGGLDIYADLTLKNGTLNAATWCVWIQNGATVNIEKDMTLNADLNTEKTDKPAVVVEGSDSASPSVVNIEGTVTARNNFAVSGNGTNGKGNVIINIKDGANISTNDSAVYMPNTWQLNISGGIITGATGVYIKSGTTNITGGTIIATGDENAYEYKDGGANSTGQAIVIDKCAYPGGAPNVTISGGTFIAEKASNVIGSYTGGADQDANPVDKFVTGGSFSSSLKDTGYLADSLNAELNSNSGADPYTYYTDVEAAKEAAKNLGIGTVTDLTKTSSVSYTVTLKYADDVTADQMLTVAENGIVILPTPTRTGYAFHGWTDGTTTYQGGDAYTVTAEAMLTATWKKTAFTVTLDYANNGETVTENRGANDGDTITLPTPTRSGRYAFVHWTDGTNTFAGGSTYTVTEDVTLTAVWRYTGSSSSGSTSSSYPVSVPRVDNGTVSVTPSSASKGTTVTITVKPNDGYELDKLTVTDQSGNRLPLSDKGNGKYTFTMPGGKVSVDASFSKIETAINFRDVAQSDYFYDAVQWAVEKGVTEGTSATTFSPNASCTRAQMVTFLWRSAGSPAPKTAVNPFKDVSTNDYYYNAVLWAVENGITSGTGADTFSPNTTVTRAQTVTFLYRTAGSPAVSGGSFSDVAANAYYANAVAWASQNNITSGTGNGKFSPNADCTRGQIVTLLYRANSK